MDPKILLDIIVTLGLRLMCIIERMSTTEPNWSTIPLHTIIMECTTRPNTSMVLMSSQRSLTGVKRILITKAVDLTIKEKMLTKSVLKGSEAEEVGEGEEEEVANQDIFPTNITKKALNLPKQESEMFGKDD